MIIAGLQKTSLVDYPGKVCAVVFLAGCNLNCFYCHNRSIISLDDVAEKLDEKNVFEFLQGRKGLLDGVCISGGEPTLQEGLEEFIRNIREMGYKVKLDTNGTNPEVIHNLLKKGLLDYIAMDIKATGSKYALVSGKNVPMEPILKSIDLVRNCSIDYEFRTTFVPQLAAWDIVEIADMIKGSKAYYLQQFRTTGITDAPNKNMLPHNKDYVVKTWEAVKDNFTLCRVRGI